MTTGEKSPRRRAARASAARVSAAGNLLGLAGVVFVAATLVGALPRAAQAQQGRLSRGSGGSLPSRLERGDRASSRPAATPAATGNGATTTARDSRDRDSRDRDGVADRSSSRDSSRETLGALSERLRDRISERRQDDRSSDTDFVRRSSPTNSSSSVTLGGSFGTINPRPNAAPTFSAPTFDVSAPRSYELPHRVLPGGGAPDANDGSLRWRDRGTITPRGGVVRQETRPVLPPSPFLPTIPKQPDLSAPVRDSLNSLHGRLPGGDFGSPGTRTSVEPRRGTLPSGGGLLPGGRTSGGAALPLSTVTLLPPRIEAGIGHAVLPRSLPRRTGRPGGATIYRGGNVYYYDYGYGYYDGFSGSYCVPPATGVSVVLPGGGAAYVFNGYGATYLPGTTFYSPYWYYRSPTFVQRSFLLTTPYPFLYGRELSDARSYGGGDEDRYFGTDTNRTKSLRASLNDLARFWEENDARALRRRVSPDFAVGVFQDENYVYSLKRADFLALSNDALDRMTTISFRFDTVRDRTDGLVNAYATHVFRVRGEQEARTATVRYTLVYVDGDWYVSAISHTPAVVTE